VLAEREQCVTPAMPPRLVVLAPGADDAADEVGTHDERRAA
jgi:hypothetical protein